MVETDLSVYLLYKDKKSMKQFILDVQDTTLVCRKYGKAGIPVIMIHGACTDVDFFNDTAIFLSNNYIVYTYDRRGYGRNEEVENHELSKQVNDVLTLIRAIGQPCHIVAHSAGSLIGMLLAEQYPAEILSLFMYEPIANDLVIKNEQYFMCLNRVKEKIEQKKYYNALQVFFSLLGEKDIRGREATEEELEHMNQNYMCFIKEEFQEVYGVHIAYAKIKHLLITIGIGELSKQTVCNEMALALSKILSCTCVHFPGGHNCPFDLPREFSYMTKSILET